MRALRQYMNSIEQRAGVDANPRASSSKKRKEARRMMTRRRGAGRSAPRITRSVQGWRRGRRRRRPRRVVVVVVEVDGLETILRMMATLASAVVEVAVVVGRSSAVRPRRSRRTPSTRRWPARSSSARCKRRTRRAAKAKADSDAIRNMPTDSAKPGSKREINRAIEKNRGLTRQRKKIDSNPRVKNREKFRKATIRRKGQVREMKEAGESYGGETTGIKKNVSHSTRFK